MTRIAIWHGRENEIYKLSVAIEHNCECNAERKCEAHKMLTEQRVLDHMAFVAKRRRDYLRNEFKVA